MRTAVAAIAAIVLLATVAAAQQNGSRSGQGRTAAACRSEIGHFCAGIPHGSGAIRACLEVRREALSPACLAAIERR